MTNTISMNLQPGPFAQIKSGAKVYELRLLDDKRRAIRIGDEIVFDCGDQICRTRVTALVIAENFERLFDIIPMAAACTTPDEMALYYPPEKQREFHVVAIKVVRI